MRIRQTLKHGNLRWIVDYKDGKGKRRRRSFADQSRAVEFANTVTEGTKRKRSGPSLTTRMLFNGYIATTKPRRSPATQRDTVSRLRTITLSLDQLGIHYAADLDAWAFAALVGQLGARGLAEETIADYVATYKAAARWGMARRLLPATPLDELRVPAPQRRPRRHLSKPEIAALLRLLAGAALQLPVAIGIYQGLRRAEVCGLRAADVELASNRLTLTAPKTKDWRTLQIHPGLLPYLPAPLPTREFLCLNDRGDPWLPNWLTVSFRRALAADEENDWAGISFHSLRHTCASHMAACGQHTLYAIGRFLGHRSVQTTQRYAHLLPDQVTPTW